MRSLRLCFPWFALLAQVTMSTACTFAELDLEGLECPCEQGFTCDESRGICVKGFVGRDAGVDTSTETDVPSIDAAADDRELLTDAGSDVALDSPDAGTACTPGTRGVWVWDRTVLIKGRDGVLDQMAAAGFGRIFVESEAFVLEDGATLVAIVQAANERCIDVELLFGAATWARPELHDYARNLARQSVILFAGEATKPRALHFDVEPYTLPEWTTDREQISDAWVSMMEGLVVDAGEYPVVMDVPFWWHEITLDRGGDSRSLLEWALRTVESVTALVYRDTFEGPNAIASLAAPSFLLANEVGGRVAVGLECTCGIEPTNVTFCEEGRAALLEAVGRVETDLGASGAYAGSAIHSWSAFTDLTP